MGAPRRRASARALAAPLAWNKEPGPWRVFCSSQSDWLDAEVPAEWLADLLDVVRRTPNLRWLLLTKRPALWRERLREALAAAVPSGDLAAWIGSWLDGAAPANAFPGVSAEDQARWNERLPMLGAIPARMRFVSAEPLLGPIRMAGLVPDWLIAGGESGPMARPMAPDWARSLRDQAAVAGIPFLFKQWGGVDKKKAGRLLDGVLHSGYPDAVL